VSLLYPEGQVGYLPSLRRRKRMRRRKMRDLYAMGLGKI